MAKIGDAVTLKIKGAPGTGTALGSGRGLTSVSVPPGESMPLKGKIIEDQGENWLVELRISIGGKNTILVSKDVFAA
tara:strand:+ start:373 stop:603 length:231 start_codon:yes stop_codon:yes gene_type:complete